LILLTALLLTGTSCKEAFDIEREKAAIIAVIQDEKDGYTNMDMDQWSRNVLQDSSYTWLAASSETYIFNHGFSKQADQTREFWSGWDPDETRSKLEFKVLEMKVYPRTAWVVIQPDHGIETLFLEKIEGNWVISGQTVILTSSFQDDDEGDDGGEDDDGEDNDGEDNAEEEDNGE